MTIDQLKLTKYEKFFNLLPNFIYKIPHKKWIISTADNIELLIILHYFLQNNLLDCFTSKKETNHHIFSNMIHIADSNHYNLSFVNKTFQKMSKNINIYHEDYLTFDHIDNPDIIILEKSYSWKSYIKKAIHSLNDFGHLLAIIPNLWFNKNHSMYLFLTQFHISYLYNIDDTKCALYLHKKPTDDYINIYDDNIQKYIRFFVKNNIPFKNYYFINKMIRYVNKYSTIFIKSFDSNKKENNIKLIIDKNKYLIPIIDSNKLPFLKLYLKSNIVNYIFFSFNYNILSAFDYIPNILNYSNEYYKKKNDYNYNIDNFLYKFFNISIINIDDINNFIISNRSIHIEIS